MERRRSLPDVLAGGIFVLIGGAFVVGSLGYELGTPLRMGPGAAAPRFAGWRPDKVHRFRPRNWRIKHRSENTAAGASESALFGLGRCAVARGPVCIGIGERA